MDYKYVWITFYNCILNTRTWNVTCMIPTTLPSKPLSFDGTCVSEVSGLVLRPAFTWTNADLLLQKQLQRNLHQSTRIFFQWNATENIASKEQRLSYEYFYKLIITNRINHWAWRNKAALLAYLTAINPLYQSTEQCNISYQFYQGNQGHKSISSAEI